MLASRKRRDRASHAFHNLWPEWKHDVWCGRYFGYGRDKASGVPLFKTLQNALRFAQAVHNAGYRITRRTK